MRLSFLQLLPIPICVAQGVRQIQVVEVLREQHQG